MIFQLLNVCICWMNMCVCVLCAVCYFFPRFLGNQFILHADAILCFFLFVSFFSIDRECCTSISIHDLCTTGCVCSLHLQFEPMSNMKYYNCIMIIILLLYNACWLISDYGYSCRASCHTDWEDFNISRMYMSLALAKHTHTHTQSVVLNMNFISLAVATFYPSAHHPCAVHCAFERATHDALEAT